MRIVLKVGSAVLTQDGKLALERLRNLVDLIDKLKQKNYQVILVSSGAVAAGFTVLQLDKSILANKQSLASIGQPLLMDTYRKKFGRYNIICSQVLMEASVFKDTRRLGHAQDAINNLLENGVVPIINENDVTAVDELVFGDNDQLAAYTTHYFDAKLLVILTDIDGYYDYNPHENKDAKLCKYVDYISDDMLKDSHTPNSEFATGGIVTKLKAAKFLLDHNSQMFLGSGFNLDNISQYLLYNVHNGGTLFRSK
ncbi:MAG: glutamate 5-kinase [Campylobacterales bacterium]|nr:glutamate 5-kinase [Campylobacterales bacterium]